MNWFTNLNSDLAFWFRSNLRHWVAVKTLVFLSRHPLPTTEATWHGCTVDGDGTGSLTVWLAVLLAGRASECVYEQFALKTPDGGGFDR